MTENVWNSCSFLPSRKSKAGQDCCSLSDFYTLPLYPLSIVKKVMFPCYIFSVYNSSLKWQELYALFIVYFTESHNYTDNNGRLSDLGFAVHCT